MNPNRATFASPSSHPGGYLIGDLVIEPRLRRIRHPDGEVELTQRVFDLLHVFVAEPFTLHARETLFERVWGTLHIEDTNLTQTISVLRKALGESRKHWIKTISRVGYSFEPPCEVRYVEDCRELAPPLPQELAIDPPPAMPMAMPEATVVGMPRPMSSPAARASMVVPLLLMLVLGIGLTIGGSRAIPASTPDAQMIAPQLEMSILITEPAHARSDAERRATRLLREWVRWKLSRLPSIDLVDAEDLIDGRANTSYFLDIELSAVSGRADDLVLDIRLRPVYRTKPGNADIARRRIRMTVGSDGLPALVDTASGHVLQAVLGHRQRDSWPALALDASTADRFAEAAMASHGREARALRLLEDVVRSAPEFAPARLLLAREMACRKQFRQAAEQAELARALTTPLPADALSLLEAETSAFTRTHADRALALYAQLSAASPKRMDFVLAQARILQRISRPEDAFQLLSMPEWEHETGRLRIRQLIAHAESAFMLGYLDQAEQSANDAIERIEHAQAGRTPELGAARLVYARMWSQKYGGDTARQFALAAEAFDAAERPHDAAVARFYESLHAQDVPLAQTRLAPLLKTTREYGDHANEIWMQRMMAILYRWDGDRAASVRMMESGLESAGLAGDVPTGQLMELDLLGDALLAGDLAQAARRVERLRHNRLWTKYRYRAAEYESEYLILSGRYRDALSVLDRTLGDTSRGTRWDMPASEAGDIACARMMALILIGESSAARAQSRSCRDHHAAHASLGEARIALLDGDRDAALRHMQAAEADLESPPDDYGDIASSTELAMLKIRLGDPKATPLLNDLHRSPAHLGYGALLAEIEVGLAEAAAARGDWPAVAKYGDSVRVRVPEQARHFLNRLELLELRRLQAGGDHLAAAREASRIGAVAHRDGAAVILAELAAVTAVPDVANAHAVIAHR